MLESAAIKHRAAPAKTLGNVFVNDHDHVSQSRMTIKRKDAGEPASATR